MTDKQARFCEEYMIDLNATQAAIRAGYSPKTANEQAARLLANVSIQNRIAQLQAEQSRRTGVSADRVVRELAKVAFVNAGDLIDARTASLKSDAAPDDLAAVQSVKVKTFGEDGLEQEARWLREQGYSAPSFQAIGYKEMGLYLDGEETLEQACERIRQESRRYAKRQLTWFRRDERYHWFWADEFADAEQMHRQMAQLAQQMLLK